MFSTPQAGVVLPVSIRFQTNLKQESADAKIHKPGGFPPDFGARSQIPVVSKTQTFSHANDLRPAARTYCCQTALKRNDFSTVD